MGGDGRVMKDRGNWEATGHKYHHPLKGLKITLYLLRGNGQIKFHFHPVKSPG